MSARSDGLRCEHGHDVSEREGYLDFLGEGPAVLALSESFFLSPLVSRVYQALRERLAAVVNGRTFREETALLGDWLELTARSTVLDVPCGQGNFTAALARRCPQGMVVALDLSDVQLRLAREHLAEQSVHNVLLVRASALELPLGDGVFDAVVTPGGLHLYPDVPRAIAEMYRVLRPEGPVAGLTIRRSELAPLRAAESAAQALSQVRFHDFDRLGELFATGGFTAWRWERGRVVGWFAARKPAQRRAVPSPAGHRAP